MAKLKKFSDNQIAQFVKESASYRDLSIKLGMTGGSSYPTIKKRVESLKLDTSHFTGKTWNKGKTKETHPSLRQQAESYKAANHQTWVGRKHRPETREKMSAHANTWATTPGTVKLYSVFNPSLGENLKVQGTWELKFATWLNENKIKWERSRERSFRWVHPNEDHFRTYYPDFYLPESDLYVEIKGYLRPGSLNRICAKEKLRLVQEQNPDMKLVILMKEELTSMGILKSEKPNPSDVI